MPGDQTSRTDSESLAPAKTTPERHKMEPKLCTPAHFHEPLREAWNCGVTRGRVLLALIQGLGYTGSLSHLARYLAPVAF